MGVFSPSNRMTVTEVGVSEWRCSEFTKTFGCSLGIAPGIVLVAVSTAKDAILRCFLPSKTTKSSCFRSATAPFLSWTTTLTCTRRVLERMTTGAPDWAPDWATARPAEGARVKSAGFMDALVEPPNYSRMEKAPQSCHYEDTNDAQIRARLSVYH